MNAPKTAGPSPLAVIDPQAASRALLLSLARDVAFTIEKIEDVLARRGMTQEQYDKLLNNPYYKRALQEADDAWKASANAENRLRITAAYLAEDALPHLWKRATDGNEPLSSVNAAIQTLLKTAGVGEKVQAQGTGEKFQININIGEGKVIHQEFETKTIDATATEGDPHVKTIGRSDPDQEGSSG